MKLKNTKINKEYHYLFIDRDGVINKHCPNDYVKKWEEFEFIPGALNALHILSNHFKRIIIITNQRGVGKGLMSEEDLKDIHYKMISEINNSGGKIDKIYYCSDIDDSSYNRKPNPGMALLAQKDFPEIIFEESIMIGDSPSDMSFGLRLGMKTIRISSGEYPLTLLNFARSIKKNL